MRERQVPENMLPGLKELVKAEVEIRERASGQSAAEPKLPAPVDARIAVVPSIRERRPYFVH